MALDMPELPPELLALYGKRLQANALAPPNVAPPAVGSGMPAGPAAQPAAPPMAQPAPAAAPGLASAFGRPTTQVRTKFTPPEGAQPAAAPSDDPALTGSAMPPIPSANIQPGPMTTQYNAHMKDLAAATAAAPQRSDYKPKWYDRVLGGATGFAAGWGNAERGTEIGSGVTNRRWNQAESQYQSKVSPLQQQVTSERPAAQLEMEGAQQGFERQAKTAELGTQRFTAKSNASNKDELTALKGTVDAAIQSNNAAKIAQGQEKLEDYAKKIQQDYDQKTMTLDTRDKLADMANSLKQQQMQQNFELRTGATDRASLEKERAARLRAVEDTWNHSPTWMRMTAALGINQSKEQATKEINDDINSRLTSAGPSAATPTAAPASRATKSAPPAAGSGQGQATHDYFDAKGNHVGTAINGKYVPDQGGSASAAQPAPAAQPPQSTSRLTVQPIPKGVATPSISLFKGYAGKAVHLKGKDGNVTAWALKDGVPTYYGAVNK